MRKPHIVRLSDGWWCAGFDGPTPWLAYSKWMMSAGLEYFGLVKWVLEPQHHAMIGIEE